MDENQRRASLPLPDDVPATNVVDLRHAVTRREADRARPTRPHRRLTFRLFQTRPRLPRTATPHVAKTRSPRPPVSLAFRRISPFGALALVLVVPVLVFSWTRPLRAWEGRLTSASAAALAAFTDAGSALAEFQFAEATQKFASAKDRFAGAYAELENIRGTVRTLLATVPLTRGKVEDGRRLLSAGQRLSEAGGQLSTAVASLLHGQETTPDSEFTAGKAFLEQSSLLSAALSQVQTALRELEQVDPSHLPRPYRQRFATFQENIAPLKSQLAHGEQAIPFLEGLFGADRPREYLFLFANDAELRPGGGFLGSLALVRFSRGGFSILDAPGRGPFDVNDFFPRHLVPPQPIQSVAPIWTLHDANWFPDFPTSAAKVAWFYEQARGFPIDGVVMMTPRTIERVLAVVGPVSLPKYGLVLTADNFLPTTQEQVEVKYDRAANQPKKFVIDLIPALLATLSSLPPDKTVAALAAFDESLATKDLVFWLKDEAQRSRLTALEWTGAWPDPPGDVVAIVDANLGGGKTSRVVQKSVTLDVAARHGEIEHTLQIIYRHTGDPDDRWTGPRYRGYVKTYLPKGSVVLEARGFDRLTLAEFFAPPADALPDADLAQLEKNPLLDETSGIRQTDEFGLTAFGGWLVLNPGQERVVTIRYRSASALERKRSGSVYRLTVPKQLGAAPYPLTVRVAIGKSLQYSSFPAAVSSGVASLTDTIATDRQYFMLFKK